ncbi:hypothetical protein [Massilia sp. BJB1822]|uniref:hypothetical protein n=1 Tax=Massilia sp. BJB1822 TaxID=2744470 RepID=UPI001E4CCC02|nr:hypothetical protein [Massilia sp. BJB1822]
MAIPPRIDAPGVRPPTPVETRLPAAPVGDARQEAFQRSLQSLVGQTIKGEVLSKFNDGSFLVRVANTNARMMLPAGVELGAELPLTVMSANPRPTFQVGTQSGQQAVLYSESGQLPADADTLPSQTNPALSGRLPSQPGAGGARRPAPRRHQAMPLPPRRRRLPMRHPTRPQARRPCPMQRPLWCRRQPARRPMQRPAPRPASRARPLAPRRPKARGRKAWLPLCSARRR